MEPLVANRSRRGSHFAALAEPVRGPDDDHGQAAAAALSRRLRRGVLE